MSVSVLTLVRGRRAHLANLIAGLNASRRKPDELVIAYMQPAAHIDLPSTGFPIREVFVSGDAMPLAAARNRAAAAASGKQLIFLDVDCVPSPTLVERYVETGSEPGGIRLGEVLYLPAGAITDSIDFVALDRIGKRHPDKPPIALDEIRPTPTHGELWGLSFGISAADWTRAGGMDERYVGYGGEETDFAARLERAGVAMWWVGGARAYHQHHIVHTPAYQHFDAIIRNARLFRATWGRWCMQYWLGQFAENGLIAWDADAITVLRQPTEAEMIASKMPPETLFS
ncbi:GT2 family glycosyltransferase [Sphingomonas sp. PP-F2F-A104-K0414]|uniref:glycosyltransferase family 2 protein n=1 Tax=Sphingomonas sp. PP-F2F-A104-K0414 TaxID=2135661 RepID=UPI0010520037|nr:galactosyltransferase-related protein [Sphingomonas sp. PP-F2F-A104-K0414]TCP98601.1 GT2 family glycosyltransferase [Sphingomonas sp. PP-F2F-A104-K0414]